MATSAAKIDFVPDALVDFIPDAAPAQIDFVPDEVVAQEAQRATTGAVQALDVLGAPRQLDWSEVNEKLDSDRFAQVLALNEKASQIEARDPKQLWDTRGEAAKLRTQAFGIQQQMSTDTEAGRGAASMEARSRDLTGQIDQTPEETFPTIGGRNGRTPSEMLSGILGTGLSSTVQPVAESAARNLGGATGGALGAALGAAATVGTGGVAPFVLALGSTLLGSQVGGSTQEKILELTESPEETQQRQQRAAEDFAANPGASRLGATLASAPFFGPSLAQFGRAAAGDRGAILNLGLAGTIGAGTEFAAAKYLRGEEPKTEDIAAAFFSNLIMNEPTRLGRRLGLHPSSEQAAIEAATGKYEGKLPPIGTAPELQSDLGTRGTSSTADVFAGVQSSRSQTMLRQLEALIKGGMDPQEALGRVEQEAAGEALPAEVPEIPIKSSEAPVSPESAIQAEAQKVGPVIYDGVTQMGDDGFYNFSDTTSKPGTRISFTVESQAPPNAEQIAAKHAERLEAFGVKLPEHPPVEATVPAAEAPIPPAEPPITAAAAEAPLPPDPNSTSNKEAVVNAERAARDLDPVIKEARISNAESIDRAQQVVTENPLKPQEIVTRLRENPQERTISLEDSAVLLVERTRLNNARRELVERATDENLDPAERATAKAAFGDVELRLNELDQAAQDARSTWGRFGQLWQRSMRQDFSLESLTSRARLKKGEALTPEESAKVKTIADEVAVKQQEADVAVEKAEAAAVEKRVDETIAEVAKQPDLDPATRTLADRIIVKLEARADAARKRLRERFKSLTAGVDPAVLSDFVDLAVSSISKTAIKSGQWISSMVKEFGEQVRPYLQAAWDKADAQLDQVAETVTSDKKKRAAVKAKVLSTGEQQSKVIAAIGERIKEGESLDSLGRYVDKLVDSLVKGGVRDRTALVAAVKDVLEPLSPGITDRKVGELISGYGQSSLLSKDPLKVIKRDLKGQLQQVSKIQALAAKEPLKKTGPERRTASDEERRLIKEVNEAKKAAGVVTTDPETQLKSTMDSARTRLSNEVKDLTFQIETGERPPNRTPVEYDQDIQVLRGIRDRLKQTVRDLDGPQQITEEQRIAITTRGLVDSIAALENRIAGQQPKGRHAAPNTPEIQALKAKRDALRQELNEINAADSLLQENRKAEALVRSIEQTEAALAGAPGRPAPAHGPESQLVTEAREQLAAVREQLQAKRDADPAVQQERMDAAEAAVEKAIKKLDQQLEAGDISVQRNPTAAGSQRLEDLRLQRDAMNRLRNQLRAETRPRPNPLDVAVKARKSALLRQEADYQARIAAGAFGPKPRKPPVDISGSPEALDALARVETAKSEFTKLQKEWELKNRTRTEKIIGGIKQTWDAVRNLKLSMDLSAPLQTAFAIAAHPVEGVKAVGKGVRAFSEQFFKNQDTYAKRVEQQIVNSPNNKNGLYKAMKLDLSEVTGTKREENTGSILERLADLESRWQDIPDFAKGLIGLKGEPLVRGAKGIAKIAPKLLGMSIKASNAGFGAIANHMRARTADSILARSARRRGAPTKEFLELVGNQVNASTGKGGLRGEEGIRALLFAPNYYLSILKQLSFQPAIKAGIKHQGAAAREILEEYVRAAATVTSIGVLQYLFGNREKQTLDLRSGDFGRAKTDRGTSLDFTMGRGAYVTLAAQIATGQRINRQGRVEKQDASSAFLTFLKGRLSREISAGLTTAKGNDFRGKPLDAAGVARELVAPLSWQDVDDVLKREGLTRGAFIQMLNLLGVTHRLAD